MAGEIDTKLEDKLGERYPSVELLQLPLKNRRSSFFYEGEIAKIEGAYATYILLAAGDVRVYIGQIDENGEYDHYLKDEGRFKYIDSLKLTDRKINSDKVKWENNNWFEVVWLPKGSKTMESEIGDVAFDYEEGIALLQSYADQNHGF